MLFLRSQHPLSTAKRPAAATHGGNFVSGLFSQLLSNSVFCFCLPFSFGFHRSPSRLLVPFGSCSLRLLSLFLFFRWFSLSSGFPVSPSLSALPPNSLFSSLLFSSLFGLFFLPLGFSWSLVLSLSFLVFCFSFPLPHSFPAVAFRLPWHQLLLFLSHPLSLSAFLYFLALPWLPLFSYFLSFFPRFFLAFSLALSLLGVSVSLHSFVLTLLSVSLSILHSPPFSFPVSRSFTLSVSALSTPLTPTVFFFLYSSAGLPLYLLSLIVSPSFLP